MYVAVTGSKSNPDVYIMESFRKPDEKTSSRIHRKLGKYNDLLARFDGSRENMMAWAKEEARKDTLAHKKDVERGKKNAGTVTVYLSQSSLIPKDESRLFPAGTLALKKVCKDLRVQSICDSLQEKYGLTYDLTTIFEGLVFSCLIPSLKQNNDENTPDRSSALQILSEETDLIEESLLRNVSKIQPNDMKYAVPAMPSPLPLASFTAKLILRLLAAELDEKYSCREIRETLSSMNLLRLGAGYIPTYRRTNLTDDLHRICGFHTDYEYISESQLQSIIRSI